MYSGWPWAFNLKYKKWWWRITITSAHISPLWVNRTPIGGRADYAHHDFLRSGAPRPDLTAAAGDGWWVVGSKLSFLSTLLEFSDCYHYLVHHLLTTMVNLPFFSYFYFEVEVLDWDQNRQKMAIKLFNLLKKKAICSPFELKKFIFVNQRSRLKIGYFLSLYYWAIFVLSKNEVLITFRGNCELCKECPNLPETPKV